MTLPASDAFSLSHDSTRSRISSSLRPTSPKIPFMTQSRSPSYSIVHPRKTVRPRTRRVPSMGEPNGIAPAANGHADDTQPRHKHDEDAFKSRPRSRSPTSLTRRRTSGRQQTETSAVSVATKRSASASPSSTPIDWEIPRKALHSSIGFLTLYLYFSHGSPRPVVVVLSMALAVVVPADILRLNSPGFERIYERCVGFLMRESEKKTTNGVIWYMIGVIWVLTLYPLDIAVVSILILSWADTAASTIGRLWGRYTPRLPARVPILRLPLAPRKSVAGFIAGSLTGALIAAGFWGIYGRSGNIEPIWSWEDGVVGTTSPLDHTTGVLSGWLGLGVISVVSGLVSGVAEALDVGSLDDNLTLPIISGGCLLGIFKCLQYFFS